MKAFLELSATAILEFAKTKVFSQYCIDSISNILRTNISRFLGIRVKRTLKRNLTKNFLQLFLQIFMQIQIFQFRIEKSYLVDITFKSHPKEIWYIYVYPILSRYLFDSHGQFFGNSDLWAESQYHCFFIFASPNLFRGSFELGLYFRNYVEDIWLLGEFHLLKTHRIFFQFPIWFFQLLIWKY